MFKRKEFTFTKLITLLTFILFIFTLIQGYRQDFTTIIDVSFYVTAITITGGVFGATVKHMLNKSAQENCIKLNGVVAQNTSEIELKTLEETLKLKQKYNVSDDEIDEFKEDSKLDDYTSQELDNGFNKVQEINAESSENVEVEGSL